MKMTIPEITDELLLDSGCSYQLCLKAIQNKKAKDLEDELVYSSFKTLIESNDDNRVEAMDFLLTSGLSMTTAADDDAVPLPLVACTRLTDPKLFDILVLMKSHDVDMETQIEGHESATEYLTANCPALLVALSYVDISHYKSTD